MTHHSSAIPQQPSSGHWTTSKHLDMASRYFTHTGLCLPNIPFTCLSYSHSPNLPHIFSRAILNNLTLPLCVCQLLSHIQLFVTPWTVACQASLFMGFSRQEYWSGQPFPAPGTLPDSGIKLWSPALQKDSLLSEAPREILPECYILHSFILCWNAIGHAYFYSVKCHLIPDFYLCLSLLSS